MSRHFVSFFAVVAMVLLAFGSAPPPKKPQLPETGEEESSADSETASESSGGDALKSIFGGPTVTKAEFLSLKDGMSYREAVKVIGEEGEESSRTSIPGVPGVMESMETVMYIWRNNDGSNMNAMFQNDKLMMKAQFGLR